MPATNELAIQQWKALTERSWRAVLIINADDWGRDRVATETTFACYKKGRVSSTSGMVYMRDSQRAAEIAKRERFDVGLHVNLTEAFTDSECPPDIAASQRRIIRFLKRSKYALLIYHPFLSFDFRVVFAAQVREFERLYGQAPTHFDGHQHMHLSTNMLVQNLIPHGQKVRRSFSFGTGEKSVFNRFYRRLVDGCLAKRYRLTDFFFALSQHLDSNRLKPVLDLARESNVELMTHAWNKAEYDLLVSEEFAAMSEGIAISGYCAL